MVESRVEIDPATTTALVRGEALAVLPMEHLQVEKPGRFYQLGYLLVAV